jgi:hypothetical protein
LPNAIQKATAFDTFSADYIENILYQGMSANQQQQPIKLINDAFNWIRLSQGSVEVFLIKDSEFFSEAN